MPHIFATINKKGTDITVDEHAVNESALKDNSYPGRGIVMGVNSAGTHFVQVYWLMGRSDNSRNRILELKDNIVRAKAFDESKVEDPSLIIYDAMIEIDGNHVVSNGDQTTTIVEYLAQNKTFEVALDTRDYEPDAPNFTPRISGMYSPDQSVKISLINKHKDHTDRKTFNLTVADLEHGSGYCIHTYKSDGDPLPSFDLAPFPVSLADSGKENAEKFWDLLNPENRISLVVKSIPFEGGEPEFHIINKNGETVK